MSALHLDLFWRKQEIVSGGYVGIPTSGKRDGYGTKPGIFLKQTLINVVKSC
jgi:hypothetical protein